MVESKSSRPPYHILFVTSNLGGGGAERALLQIINNLDREKFNPHLATYQQTGIFFDSLIQDVAVYEIQSLEGNFLNRNLQRTRGLRQLCKSIRPDLVISIKWHVNLVTLLSLRMMGENAAPIVINEQEKPTRSADAKRRKIWPIMKWTYHWADHIIAASQGIADEILTSILIPDRKMSVVHNPVDIAYITQQSSRWVDFKRQNTSTILAAGRLVEVKGYPILLRAFSILCKSIPNAELYILGEGPQLESLQRLAYDLLISQRVHFLGFQSNPFAYMAQADVFTLSSRHEGFGNVLVEALALGVPVISTDCPHGPREILDRGRYGLLVPVDDEHAMAKALQELLSDEEKRAHLSALGKERAKDFSVEKIIPLYERKFLDLIEKRN